MSPAYTDDVVAFLHRFDLGKYETDAYLTLLQYGPQNYKGLAERSHVPYGKIYATMKALDAKGWITTLNRRPKLFCAVPPKIPLQTSIDRIKKRVSKLEATFQRIGPHLTTLYTQSHPRAVENIEEA